MKDSDINFPNPYFAGGIEILYVGGSLKPKNLLKAYSLGIFPWYNRGDPILWWCPLVRHVIFIKDFRAPKSIKKTIKKHNYTVSFNKNFMSVISGCATVKRKDCNTTWITEEMMEGYYKLFLIGCAFSIEVWEGPEIVGGLYGVKIKNYISAESMFHKRDNASDAALIELAQWCKRLNIPMIDCQITSDHIFRYNAIEITRKGFLDYLQILLNNKYQSISKGLS